MIFCDSVSSGASLSAKTTKQEDVERHLFVFYNYDSSLLADRGVENKKGLRSSLLLRRLCLGLCGEQRGWALSDAVCIVANPSLSADFDAEQMTFQSSVFVFGIIRTIGTLRQLRWLRPKQQPIPDLIMVLWS